MSANIPVLNKLNNYGLNGKKSPILGKEVGELLKDYKTIVDLLPSHSSPAICEPNNADRAPVTHEKLKAFVEKDFNLLQFGIPHNQRVAILLPNGPELAVAIVATISHWCAAPINPTNTWQEIKLELQSTKSIAMIIMSGTSTNEAALQAAEELNIGVIAISPLGSVSGLFHMNQLRAPPSNFPLVPSVPENRAPGFVSYNHPETVLLLHTSGTSGNKKLVPYSLDMIVTGVGCIIASWDLRSSDVCLNMMPLFHIGGICRNILSPLLSGGAVITCSGFDPLLFWDVLFSSSDPSLADAKHRIPKVTWYYAAPTMHHAILNEAAMRPKPLPVDSVRYIANAAGGLLPVLAKALKDTFQATILTSYGMTECMPISTPPQDYDLDPAGTSGTPVGPEILIVDDDLRALPTRSAGNIFVRGPPCFGGYEGNASANQESFFNVSGHGNGWFNTGDMGYLDEKGFLFISGRSKEIINRGGETISPFEIEEVLVQHPFVKEAIAFSAPHEQYQETVGAIIVIRPGKPKIDLPSLHKYLDDKLHRSKWPQVLVFSSGLPKNAAGKALRIKYADRIGLKNVDEESPGNNRLFDAECPPVGTALTVPITLRPVRIDFEQTKQFLKTQPIVREAAIVVVDLPSQQDTPISFIVFNYEKISNTKQFDEKKFLEELVELCRSSLDAFIVPQFIYSISSLPVTSPISPGGSSQGNLNVAELQKLALEYYQKNNIVSPRNALERQIELIWRSLLGSPTTISVTSSFFDLGGDSLKAGQLVGIMRQELRVPLTVADLFTAPSIESIAVKISMSKTLGSPAIRSSPLSPGSPSTPTNRSLPLRNEKRRARAKKFQSNLATIEEEKQEKLHREYMTWEFTPPHSSTSWGVLFIQALPITVIYPIRRIIIWFLIAAPWVYLMKIGYGRFTSLLVAMFLARFCLGLFAPLFGILMKWLLIGKYQPGKYPLWGSMYLKWWLTEQIINIMGKGYFRDDLPVIGPHMVRMYYSLMGAKIGKNVKIHKDAKIGQADLLTIGDNVAIDNCIIRPFALEEGHFVLLPIEIGNNCSIGLKSVVTAGSILPSDTHIGPLSSSYESETDSDPMNRQYCRPTYPSPPIYLIVLVGIPILLSVLAISFIPWFFVLKLMVLEAKDNGWYQSEIHSIYHAFLWWITPQRLFYFFLLRICKRCVVPFMRLFVIILIKWTLIGRFKVMKEHEKQTSWNCFRYWLMAKLMPGGGLCGVAKLVGTHYEVISVIYRLLGAKIGKNIYWPGSGLEIVEFDLLEIGDDVVFGSRSVIITSSTKASKKIVFESGSMIADRCVILPGVVLRKGAVLGSGALAAEDMVIPIGSVWLGSQHGRALNVAPSDQSFAVKDTTSPFGKAFYQGKASYFVLPLWSIALYNTFWQAFCTWYATPLFFLFLFLFLFLPFSVLSAATATAPRFCR